MLPEKLREYFSFSRKERIGIFVLLTLIVIIFILPYFFSSPKSSSDRKQFEQFKNEIAQLKLQKDSVHAYAKNYEQDDDANEEYRKPSHINSNKAATLFYFDPNIATDDEWKKLGLQDRTIRTIDHYLSKGGKFRKADDLKKIYGFSEEEYNRLLPYIRIKNADSVATNEKTATHSFVNPSFSKKVYSSADINNADTVFMSLPGIGSKLANRIISFREKLGGFYSADQVAETYGLPDSTFLKIKPYLVVNELSVKKIDVNTADVNLLKQHPYIKWNLANAIVQ